MLVLAVIREGRKLKSKIFIELLGRLYTLFFINFKVMKTIRNFYIIAGIVLILLNLKFDYSMLEDYGEGVKYSFSIYQSIWYFLFFNLLLFMGIILLIASYRLDKKGQNNHC